MGKLFSGFSKLRNVSAGLVIMLMQLWVYVNPTFFFPEADALRWKGIMLTYLLLEAVVFSLPDLRMKLFNFSLVKILPKFLFFFGITVVGLSLFGAMLITPDYGRVLSSLAGIGIGVILIHCVFTAIVEENIFRLILPRYFGGTWFGVFISQLIFAVFHWEVYKVDATGSVNLIALFVAFLAGIGLYAIQQRFSPQDASANAGAHGGWNSVTSGVIKLVAGG